MTTSSVRHLNIQALAAQCAAQTELFYRRLASNPDFCFELFRRAILRRDQAAWDALVAQYQPQIERWVRRTGPNDPEIVADLAQDAITRFWRAYGADDLARAGRLAEVLRYWQDCARSAVLDWQRKRQFAAISLEEAGRGDSAVAARHGEIEGQVMRRELGRRLWLLVRQHCQDEADLVLAHQVFVEGCKPREVYAENSQWFATQAEVYQRLRNLKDRLRRDLVVQSLLDELIR
jgi:DNA-directed RNA polymerase specialized sigma24 family protein